jgi:hypothetical protein
VTSQIPQNGAVDLALAGGVLGDVGDLQLVPAGPGELPVHQVRGGRCLVPGPGAGVAGQALDAGTAHQRPDCAAADLDAQAEGELGVHAPGSVKTPGHCVDGLDLPGQPRVPQRPG